MNIDVEAAAERICELIFGNVEIKAKTAEHAPHAEIATKMLRSIVYDQVLEILKDERKSPY